ncbi:MAG: YbhB/YbcL family Raf kinase inhibitor-like protein [Cyanobacteria bacterium QS_4_48_99]|nr:MAG: YbhB/YbcL family Raf kinase inhibitor-like protein [Cyanobacteria bacterium QH_2_48_84]PSO76106.1 MAG: YbhB/YbcL family Raf kinase inhibitor-like protein [Cyanobacteria bacterium QS_4_48_99]PSO98669.1 MAG: YbhB/YbcL family Raf kinase inhibitor-like protein [Cyanobacteria bacterium QS_9_48_30]
MELQSNSFSADSTIPPVYTCDEKGISPNLSWDEPPVETQSLALIMDSSDASKSTHSGQKFVHWVIYNLPAQTRALPEGLPPGEPTLEGGDSQGTNDFGELGYGAPCPSEGTQRYSFRLYALDTPLGLEAGATKQELEKAMEGRIVATAELVGQYERKFPG